MAPKVIVGPTRLLGHQISCVTDRSYFTIAARLDESASSEPKRRDLQFTQQINVRQPFYVLCVAGAE